MDKHYNNQPKPDDRSDNAEKLQKMIKNTKANMAEAEAAMEFSDSKEKMEIKAKNKRRQESINHFKAEIDDEQAYKK